MKNQKCDDVILLQRGTVQSLCGCQNVSSQVKVRGLMSVVCVCEMCDEWSSMKYGRCISRFRWNHRQSMIMVLSRFITLTVIAVVFVSETLALSSSPKPKFFGGAGVGRLTLEDLSSQKIACHYDMVLVERIQGRPKTESGLFVPQEDLPKLHLCKGMSSRLYVL